ncbi:MAG: hypothetical protein PHN49_10400, partial [Candidatus Omnitrophica bacterium]|nr:hypothetical protein [Candidatus Omnitrophota bacterium]
MMLVFFNFPLSAPLYAADPLENLPNNNQPEVPALGSQNDPPQNNLSGGSGDPDNPLSPVQPQGMMLMGSSPGTVTVLPGRPNIKSVGYNANGRTRYPGYVRFIPVDNNTFGYAYDLGAAPGATVDIVIGKTGSVMNLSGGYEMRLKRENKNPATGGIAAITIVFRDNTGKEYSERIQLSADYQNYAFDLSGKNINAAAISEIILRQTYEDIAVATYQEDRRGQIFVNVGGLEVQHGIDGTTLDTAALTQLPQSTGVSARGFIRGAHTVPGYITLLNEVNGTRGFRYDVGGSDGAVVQTNLWPPTGGVLALGATFVMAMKNSGNGAKALLRFKDIAGKVREFVLNLTDAYQNFVMNLEDPLDPANGFDYGHITQVDIEVTRALSRARRGQIDFYIPRSQEDPFTDVVPVIDSIQVTSSGAGVVNFELVPGAAIYHVQIAKDANFTDILHEGYPQNPLEPFQINQSGTYYARVRGSKNINVTVGPVTKWKSQSFSADVIYDKKPVVDSAATNAGGVTEIMYSPVPGAIVYHVQVATDAAFTNIVHEGYPSGAFENVNLGQDSTYYVRVRGSTSTDLNLGYVSQWSDAFEFIRDMTNRNINPDSDLDSADITNLPNGQAGAPRVTSVGPGSDATDAAQATERGVIVTYNTGTAGWAGGGFSYDDFTTTPQETGNLSAMTQLIFGIRGDADSVKFEIVDDAGKSD